MGEERTYGSHLAGAVIGVSLVNGRLVLVDNAPATCCSISRDL